MKQALEELRERQSDIQQSLVKLTNLFTQFYAQPLEEAIQLPKNPIAAKQERQERPRNPAANQEQPRNDPIHIHNNRLYGKNLPGYLLEDFDSSDENSLLSIHQEPQQGLGFRPNFQDQ